MIVNMPGHVSLPRSMSMKLKVKLRTYITLLHMLVDCLKAAGLTGLPLLKRHMLFIDV